MLRVLTCRSLLTCKGFASKSFLASKSLLACKSVLTFMSLVLAAWSASAVTASAQDRFALVIGNSQYKNVSPLTNPGRDATAVSALLKDAGFEVTAATDLDKTSMSRAIRFFTNQISGKPENTVALIYYAGHGLQVDGENFLIPVDATVSREADVPLETMRLADLMSMLDTVRSKTRIVILDACRDNPFADIAKAAPRGLALVNAPAGTLVAYSTSPGATAEDGSGSNSPFAQALIKSAKEPGLPIETALKNVRLAVHGVTGGRQTPWEISALTEPFAFFPGATPLKQDASRDKTADAWRKELQGLSPRDAFDVAVREDNVTVYEQYLALYGGDPLAAQVRLIVDRRQMMIAWLEAVTLNTPAAFAAFLARYPDSDLTETARRLEERAKARSSFARSISPVLGLTANALNSQPDVRTIVREVRVPEVRTVIKEVKVPSPPEIRTVIKEVVKEVRVPSPPEIRTVTREVIKEVKVPHEVVKVVHVPGPARPCNCGGPRPGYPPRAEGGPPVIIGGGRPPRYPGGMRPPGPRPQHHPGGGRGGGMGFRF